MRLLLLLTLLNGAAYGQVQRAGYASYPNAMTHIPDSVVYPYTPHQRAVKRLASFHGGYEKDYLHTHLDIGHMKPAEDADDSEQNEYDSFDTRYNTFPQVPNLNRIVWLALENYVRSLNKPVRVKVYWSGIKCRIGKDSLAVPAVCGKVIMYDGKVERYEIPNVDSVSRHPFSWYRVK